MTNICTGDICRPGGLTITDRAIAFCGFPQNAKIIDIGCGLGTTVRHVRHNYGFNIWGIEKADQIAKLARTEFVLAGNGAQLPFGEAEIDGLLFECSLSKMNNAKLVLAQCYHVLKPKGYLIISDVYARCEGVTLSGLLGRVETKEALLDELRTSGFTLELFEDYTDALQAMWGQFILEHGSSALHENLGTDGNNLRKIKIGYCLIIAQRGQTL